MQEIHQENKQEIQDNPQDYSKTSKKPRRDFTRESRKRKRLVDTTTGILAFVTPMSIPLTFLAGVI